MTKRRVAILGVFGLCLALAFNIGFAIAMERGFIARALLRFGVNPHIPIGYMVDQHGRAVRQIEDAPDLWYKEFLTSPGVDAYQVIRSDVRTWDASLFPKIFRIEEPGGVPRWVERPTPEVLSVATSGYGWPFVSMYRTLSHPEPTPFPDYVYMDGGHSLAVRSNFRIYAPGLLVNTLTLGAAFAAGMIGFGSLLRAVRSARRRARGRCGRCGYELTGLATLRCPECGAASDSRAKPGR